MPAPPQIHLPVPFSATPVLPADPAPHRLADPVQALVRHPPVSLPPSASIQAAARLMREQRVSSVLVVEQGHLFGLVTDRDLRNRVIADGLDSQRCLVDIATLAPLTIAAQRPALDALLLMARHNIHHLPVLDGHRVSGLVTAHDLAEPHSGSAVYLVSDIHKQDSLNGLRRAAAQVAPLQRSLAAAGTPALGTGHLITAVTDALTQRLLQLGEMQLGPAPVAFAWLAAGSQARSEQTARTDQDNALLFDDAFDPERHGAYFEALARFVCDGLDACGYVHCPGGIMAMNPDWRLPRRHWARHFAHWTDEPDPTALMLTSVFFDLRAVQAPAGLLEPLRREVLQRTRGNGLFLTHLMHNALQHQPPLGLFGGLATARSGEHRGTLDLKHAGVVPIVDLARVCALAGGDEAVNTHERLLNAPALGTLAEQDARDLRDALAFLALARIQHQARQLAAGQTPDNHLKPDELSNFERSQLKDAFAVVRALQQLLGQRHQAGRF